MDLILVGIALIGLAAWASITYVKMPPPFPMIIIVVAVIFVLLWLLRMMGYHIPNVVR